MQAHYGAVGCCSLMNEQRWYAKYYAPHAPFDQHTSIAWLTAHAPPQ